MASHYSTKGKAMNRDTIIITATTVAITIMHKHYRYHYIATLLSLNLLPQVTIITEIYTAVYNCAIMSTKG